MSGNDRDYRDVEAYILDIPKFTKKHEQKETDGFYAFLGRPGERQKIIHVAGTNGKGSVCAFTESMILATGHTCGLFTSPHLECMRERIRFQKQDIPEEDFVRIFFYIMERAKAYREDYIPTFFELLFLMAMVWYEEVKPEYIILETGLGGRLDATNIVKHKEICIITRIALDHTEYLGDTLEKIAEEKSGIIAEKTPVVYYHENDAVSRVIRRNADEKKAAAYPISEQNIQNLKNRQKYIDFYMFFEYYGYYSVSVSSCALYQGINAALALFAARTVLGEALTPGIAEEAIRRTSWPCRMEEAQPGIILDGAHNPDGMRALLESISCRQEKKILLFAVMSDKDTRSIVREIIAAGCFEQVIITTAGGVRAADTGYLKELFRGDAEHDRKAFREQDIITIENADEAFGYAVKIKGDRLLVVAGSLYLTGRIHGLIAKKEDR